VLSRALSVAGGPATSPAAVFLAAPASDFVTGAAIPVEWPLPAEF
jgi:hypothetical protein